MIAKLATQQVKVMLASIQQRVWDALQEKNNKVFKSQFMEKMWFDALNDFKKLIKKFDYVFCWDYVNWLQKNINMSCFKEDWKVILEMLLYVEYENSVKQD